MTELSNPRAVTGSNQAPDYAQQVTDRLAAEYAEIGRTLNDLLGEASAMPEAVASDNDALTIGGVIKRLRDLDARVEGVRVLEKESFLRGGNAVDSFFNGMRDRIGKRNKNDRAAVAGATDTLQARINVYQEQKIAQERARREAERLAAERASNEARERAVAAATAAREAEEAIARVRKPESIAAREVVADQRAADAVRAQAEREQALQLAEDARLATFAKPADMSRIRGNDEAGGGVTLTTAQEPYALVSDRTKLQMSLLWPFFTDAEIEKALRAWARTTGHRIKMDGAEIGFRSKGVTR